MKFEYLKAFITVVDCNSFTKAAQSLFLSQPTISRYIVSLEEQVGTPLLVRDKRENAVILTPAGQQLYTDCKALLEEMNCSEQRARDISTGTAGTLVISDIPPYWKELYEIIELFYEHYPKVDVRVISTSKPPHQRRENADILVMHSFELFRDAKPWNNLFVRQDPFYVMMCPDCPLANKSLLTINDIISYPLIDSGGMGRDIAARYNMHFYEKEFFSMETSICDMRAVKGVMIVTQSSSEAFASITKSVPLLLHDVSTQMAIYFTWDKHKMNPIIPHFIDVAKQYISNYK